MNDNYDTITIFAGSINIPMLDSLVSKNVEAGWKDHKKNYHDAEKDEGAKEISSKSLSANVLDIEDVFRGKNPPYM